MKRVIHSFIVTLFLFLVAGLSGVKAQNCATGNCLPNTYIYSTDPNTIEYDNIVSVFHSSMIREADGTVKVWGQGTSPNGSGSSGNELVPRVLNNSYGSGSNQLTGNILKFTGGSNLNSQQFAVLTTNGLYVWGNSGVLVPAVSNAETGSFRKVAVGTFNVSGGATKADGLPNGVNPADVKMMFGTREGLAIVTCTGAAYTLTIHGMAYGDGATDSGTNDLLWHRVSTATNTPLTNVVAVRGTYQTFMALTSNGDIYTWGVGTRINSGGASDRNFATLIPKPAGVTPKMIGMTGSSGGKTYYLLATDGKLYAMGENEYGQLGNGGTTDSNVWGQVTASTSVDGTTYTIAPGGNVTWISPMEHDRASQTILNNASINIITDQGKIWAWGGNSYGMLGFPTSTSFVSTPGLMPGRITGAYNNAKLNLSDVMMAVETGGHTTLLIKQCSKKFGYVGHRIRGSMADGTDPDAQETEYNFGQTADVTICGAPTSPGIQNLEICPTQTADLNDAILSPTPDGFYVEWWTTANRQAGTQLSDTDILTVGPGTYYTFYIANTGPCESPAYSEVKVTEKNCIEAIDDTYGPYNGIIGGTTGSVLVNDLFIGQPVNPSDINLTPGTPSYPGLVMNADGTITVPAGTPTGTYTYPYTICLIIRPAHCDDAVATITVYNPAIELTKTASPGPHEVGDVITYTFTVKNTGDVTLTNVSVNDLLPGLGPISPASEPSLAPGATTTFTALYTVTQGNVDNGKIDNTATTKGTPPSGPDVTDTDDETVTFTTAPAIELTKTGSPQTYNVAGDVITYTFTVKNMGNVTLTGVVVNDALTGSVNLAVTPSTLAPGQTGTASATYTIKQTDVDAGKVDNTAIAKGTPPSGPPVEDDDDETVTSNPAPGIKLTKTGSPQTYNVAGDVITYTFTVENTGNETLTGVVVNDALTGSVNLAVTPSTLAPGQTGTASATYTIKQTDVDAGKVDNTATAKGTPPSGPPVEDDDDETVTSNPAPGIKLTKTGSPQTYNVAGDVITYTFTVENTGNETLTGVVVNDALTNSVNLSVTPSTLAPGQTGTASATYTIKQTDVDAGKVDNTATAKGTPPSGPPVEDDDDETVTSNPAPGIKLTKTGSPQTYNVAGDVITYTFTVENTGNETLTGVVVNDALTNSVNLSVTPSTLAPGQTGTASATYTIKQTDVDAGKVDNTATAKGTPPSGPPVEDDDDETVTSNPAPGIKLTKTGSPQTYNVAGDVITYTFTVENTGNETLTGVVVNDALTGSVNLSVTPSTLAPGQTGTASATYTIKQTDVDAGKVDNTATAKGTPPSGPPVEDDDDETVTSNPAPGIKLTKTGSPQTYNVAGDVITYTFTVENTGNETLTGVVVNDALTNSVNLSVTPSTLAPGQTGTASATYTIKQTDVDAGKVDNTATAKGTPPSGPPVEDDDDETVTSNPAPGIKLTKTGSPQTYNVAGDVITYTFTVENTGNETLTGVVVNDALTNSVNLAVTPSTLAPGQTGTASATYTIKQTDVDAGKVDNTATAKGTPPSGPPVEDDDDETVTSNPAPGIKLTKTGSPQTYNVAGDVITYTFTVENTGNETLTGVVVNDALTGSVNLAVTPSTLAPGQTGTASATYTIKQTDVDAGKVDNTATAKGTPPGGTPVEDDDDETVTSNPAPGIKLTKTGSPQTYNVAGDVITYTFTVENTGNETLTGVVVNDALTGSVNLAVTPSTLAPGQTGTASATYTIKQTDVDAGKVDNTATAKGTPPSGPPVEDDDDETVTSNPAPGIKLTKTGSPQTYNVAGDVITYTFTVENTGNETLTGVVVNDALTGSVNLSVTPSTLAPGQTGTASATYTIKQTDVDAGKVDNTATAKGTPPSGPPVEDDDDETVTSNPAPGIKLTKTGSPQTYNVAGDVITYTFTVENTGNETLTGVVVNDALTGSVNLAVTPSTLAPGQTGTASATYTIKQTDVDAGKVDNTATAKGTPPSGPDVTDTDDETVTSNPAPGIKLTKTGSPQTYNVAGDVITYTFTVENTGNETLTGVVVNDALTGSVNLAVTPSTLAPGQTGTASATYTIKQTDVDAGKVDNTATAKGTPPSGPDVTDTDDETVTSNPAPGIKLTKTGSPQTYNVAGDVITYTFTVENTGNETLTGVVVNDALTNSVNLSVTPSTLAPGQTGTASATYTIKQTDVDAGKVDNTATAKGTPPSGPPVEDDDDETVTSNPAPGIKLTKTGSPQTYNVAGDVITYTFTVENTGNETLTGVVVNDALTNSVNLAVTPSTLAPGQTGTASATYTIKQTDVDAGKVDNTATAKGTPPSGPPVEDDDDETVTSNPAPGIKLTKTGSPQTYNVAGDVITYTFTVENTGNETLTGVVVNDALTGSVNLAVTPSTLAPGQTGTASATYTIKQTDVDAGKVDNTATAKGTPPSGPPVEDDDDETVTSNPAPGIELTKTASAGPHAVGDEITYSFKVKNTGNVTLTNVTVTDPLPDLSATTPASVASLEPGAETTFTATYTVKQSDVNNGNIHNTATAKGTPPSGPPVEDEDEEDVPFTPAPGIELTKTASAGPHEVGDEITYSFKVKNTGNVTLTNITVTDPLPDLSATTPASVASLEPGAETTFTATYTVKQSDVDNGNIHNTATAKGTPPSGPPVEDEDEEDVPFTPAPGIELIKSGAYVDADGNSKVNPGDEIHYTFTVTNTGKVTLTNVTVTDPKVTVVGGPIASLAPGAVDSTTFTATYTITQSDINAGQVDNTAEATGKDPKGDDVSDEDEETVELGQIFDLALRKSVKPGQKTVFKPGDNVTFEITVFNQGNVDATDIDLVDYIPTGLTLNDANWALDGTKARWVGAIPSLAAGTEAMVSITFTLNDDAVGGVIINIAEISGAKNEKNLADIDSTPDDNKDNDGIAKNDEIDEDGKKGGDEDDHDIEPIMVCPDQKCLTAKVKVNK